MAAHPATKAKPGPLHPTGAGEGGPSEHLPPEVSRWYGNSMDRLKGVQFQREPYSPGVADWISCYLGKEEARDLSGD